MHSRPFIGIALLLLGLFAPSAPALADPIVITGGIIVQPGGVFNVGNGNLVGTQNFIWIGQIDPFAGFGSQCEDRCSPGATVDIGQHPVGDRSVKGEVTYLDQRFRIGGSPDTGSFGQLFMDFTTEPYVLPPVGSSAAFSSAFTMSGQLTFPFPPFQPDVLLSGSGTARALFVPSFPPTSLGWRLDHFTYEFSSDPVPEPSTMLLAGGGLVALLRRRLRPMRTRGAP